MDNETTRPKPTLTWEQVAYFRKRQGEPRKTFWETRDAALSWGKCYMVFERKVYQVALPGVAGALDPPERLGTVGEILGGDDDD